MAQPGEGTTEHQLLGAKVTAIVPCYNEAGAIAKVVADLKAAMPGMRVIVYDNNSSDNTADVARKAGAEVRFEERKGKGNVVRRAFADIDSDIYMMIDGDDTYDAAALPAMVQTLLDGPYDHVLGVRTQPQGSVSSYRPGHEAGNRMFNRIVSTLFGSQVSDMLSGYRVFSKRFVKSFPAMSHGFEIETELTIHCMALRVPQKEVAVGFGDRAEGTISKLSTFKDGFKILSIIGKLLMYERPMLVHSIISALLLFAGLAVGLPVVFEFFNTGLVPRLPSAVLAAGLVMLSAFIAGIGMITRALKNNADEARRMAYLRYEAPAYAPSTIPDVEERNDRVS
ncbi:MAG: glycosyltransferase [Actinomycetaceae bacterium]|nr:glycosyltransferase [Actinomycetaceae bacterium]